MRVKCWLSSFYNISLQPRGGRLMIQSAANQEDRRSTGCLLLTSYMLFPGPGRCEGLLDSALSLPAELFIREGRICPDSHDVTWTAVYIFIIEFQVVDFLESRDKFINRYRTAGSDIEDFILPSSFRQPFLKLPLHGPSRGLRCRCSHGGRFRPR